MKNFLAASVIGALLAAVAMAQPLLTKSEIRAISEELSGSAAKRNLEFIAREHRIRGSRGFRRAAEFIAGKLRTYGLSNVVTVS